MNDRIEYWWVDCNAEVQPAEVTFRGGIPVHARIIGSRDVLPTASLELIGRLPAAPKPGLERSEPPAPPARETTSPIWLIGIILLLLVYWFSGSIFDAIR